MPRVASDVVGRSPCATKLSKKGILSAKENLSQLGLASE